MKFFIPVLSSWNTPSVLPVPRESSTCFIIVINMIHIDLVCHVSVLPSALHSGSPSVYEGPGNPFSDSPSSSNVVMVNWVVSRSVCCPGKRHILIYCLLTDDHACRMHGGMPWQSLQAFGHIDQLFYLLIRVIIKLLKLRIGLQTPYPV